MTENELKQLSSRQLELMILNDEFVKQCRQEWKRRFEAEYPLRRTWDYYLGG